MDKPAEPVLVGEVAIARDLLLQALAILDAHGHDGPACLVAEAVERLIGAPTVIEQWYLLTDRNADGSWRT